MHTPSGGVGTQRPDAFLRGNTGLAGAYSGTGITLNGHGSGFWADLNLMKGSAVDYSNDVSGWNAQIAAAQQAKYVQADPGDGQDADGLGRLVGGWRTAVELWAERRRGNSNREHPRANHNHRGPDPFR